MNKLKERDLKLRKLAIYGLGCAVKKLNAANFSKYLSFTVGRNPVDEDLLKRAIPKAYNEVMKARKDCREYFLTQHNKDVLEEGANLNLKNKATNFCLAREGEIVSIKKAGNKENGIFDKLFGENYSSQIKCVGRVAFPKENNKKRYSLELVILDTVPEARIGSIVTVHRKIACEVV